MKITNKIKLSFYPELKNLGIDEDTLNQIISNKDFKNQYKNEIKPFLENLQKIEYHYGSKLDKLDENIIKQHARAVFELSKENNAGKYIHFINKKSFEQKPITNYKVFNDSNFESLNSILGNKVFNENICEIINKGYSNRLIEFKKNNAIIDLTKINPALFSDKVWNVIKNSSYLENEPILKTILDQDKLINEDLLDGLKYTYDNILESHNFIEYSVFLSIECPVEQFSWDFIKNVGDET